MGQFEYNDLNKFYVSAGVFLIGMTFLMPWLYLRESFDLTIKIEDLEKYTEVAQEVLRKRQNISGTLTWFIPVLSVLSFLSGLILIAIGTKKWSKLQTVIEKREEMINEELRLRIKEMSSTEKRNKVEEDLKNQEPEKTQSTEKRRSLANKYLAAENTFFELVQPIFENEFIVSKNQQIDRAQFDLILRAPYPMNQDIILELKYSEARVGGNYFHSTLDRFKSNLKLYQQTVKENTIGRIVFLLPDSALNNESKHPESILPDKTIDLLENRDKELVGTDIRVCYFNLDKINTYNEQEILKTLKIKI